jgi:hypothetical protein
MANATFNSQAKTDSVNPATYIDMVGGTISLVLLIGVVAWGAHTLMRDSTGVPVVRALDGPLRIAPLDPGGVSASHQGLTVNEVASSQNPATRNDPFQLAPQPISLKEEDQPILLSNAENIPLAISAEETLPSPVMAGTTIEDLIASLAKKTNVQNNIEIIPVGVGFGPSSTPRPQLRPRSISLLASRGDPFVQISTLQITPTIGTRMVQLGAYDSEASALAAWAKLSQRHGDYLVGKPYAILKGKSGEATVYRLRVHGFDDATESRRLCAALIAQNATCHSVLMY